MKKLNTWYWVTTIVIALYMLFTAYGSVIKNKESIDFINGIMGFPVYFIPFIGVAKVLGCIGILIPGFTLLKHWAYAGLFFDLVAAIYSVLQIGPFNAQMILFMIVPALLLLLSYYLWLKKTGQATDANRTM